MKGERAMSFSTTYWQRRLRLTVPESIATLSAMERFFEGDGKNWSQDAYHHSDGTKCLLGAAKSMGRGTLQDAPYWIWQAIAERHPDWVEVSGSIEAFNDSPFVPFGEVAEVLARAKQLAAAAAPSQAPAAEIPPPPPRAALTHQPEERVEIITMADLERVAVRRRE
jgi:hypothetical protein